MQAPLVTIVIICWNNKRYLEDCLSSVLSQIYPNIEVFLADNASSDGSADYVRRNFPSITVIQNERNLGFAEGNNVAMRQAKGKYIFTLNPDTKMNNNCIEELVKVAERDKDIGSCSPKILLFDDPKRINSAGGDMVLRTGDNIARGFYSIDDGRYDKEEEVFGSSASASFYRKKVLNKVGLFDKDLFTYYEDVDMNWRFKLAGWKCIYVPNAIVYHHHAGTLDDYNPIKIFYLHRNKLYVILKNYPLKLLNYYLKIIIKNELLFFRLSVREKNLAGIKGQLSVVLSLPKILFKRIKQQPKRKISAKECIAWIEKNERYYEESNGLKNVQAYFEDLRMRKAKMKEIQIIF